MTNKKKLLIIACAVCAIIFVGLITTIIVLVATANQKANSNLAINYEATDVLAEMSATYNFGDNNKVVMTDGNGNSSITFDATSATGTLSPNKKIELTKQQTKIIFEYKFTNLSGTESYPFEIPMATTLTYMPDCNGDVEGESLENVNVYYFATSTEVSVDKYNIIPFVEQSPLNIKHSVSTNSTKYIYVLVEVANTYLNASLEGNIQWTLNREAVNVVNALSMFSGGVAYTNNEIMITEEDNAYITLQKEDLSAVPYSAVTVRSMDPYVTVTKNANQLGNNLQVTITKDSSIKKQFKAVVAFDYNGSSTFVVVNFVDVNVQLELDNADDIYYGLQQERVFGVWSLGSGSTTSSIVYDRKYAMQYTKTEDTQDTIYWKSSDTTIATVDSNGVVTFKTATNFSGKKNVTISVGYSAGFEEGTILDSYTFTLVGGCNIWSANDFYILDGYNLHSVMVLQTSLGVDNNDRVLTKPGATTYRPCDTTFALTSKDWYYLQETIYGNGFVMNFANSTSGYGFYSDLTTNIPMYNLVVRGHRVSDTYSSEIIVNRRKSYYCVFEYYKLIGTSMSQSDANSWSASEYTGYYYNCMFRNSSKYGLFINNTNIRPVVIENCIFKDSGMSAIYFEDSGVVDSKLYINGRFECDNVRVVGDYETTYQDVIKNALNNNPKYSSNSTTPASGNFNSVILRGGASKLANLKSLKEDLYFGGVLFTGSSANTSSTGHDYDIITGEKSSFLGLVNTSAEAIVTLDGASTLTTYSFLYADYNKFINAGHLTTEAFMNQGSCNLNLYS